VKNLDGLKLGQGWNIDAEGCVVFSPIKYKEKTYLRCYINCSSTNSIGLKQVSKLLDDSGIKYGIYSYRNNYEWRITIKSESISKFNDLIGFSTEPNNLRLKLFTGGVRNGEIDYVS
jgi:hypothetical protein